MKQLHLRWQNKAKIWNKIPPMIQDILSKHQDLMLAGGSVAAILNGTKSEDYDLFYCKKDHKEFVNLCNHLMQKVFYPYFTWNRRTTPKGEVNTFLLDKLKIQLIYLDHESPEAVLDSFDLFAVKLGINHMGLIGSKQSLNCCLRKLIKFSRIEYPVISFQRFLKYRDKGYKVDNALLKEFLLAVQARILTYNLVDGNMSVDELWASYMGELE